MGCVGVWAHTCRLNLYAPYTPSWHVKKLFYCHIYRRRHGKGENILQNFVAECRIKRLHGSTKHRLENGLHRKSLCALKLLACCMFSPTSSYTHMCKTKKEKLFGCVLREAWQQLLIWNSVLVLEVCPERLTEATVVCNVLTLRVDAIHLQNHTHQCL